MIFYSLIFIRKNVFRNGISDYGYVGCYAITVHRGESIIANKDNYLFITDNGIIYLVGYVGKEKGITLPLNYNGENNVIYSYAFYRCTNLTSVTYNGTMAQWSAIRNEEDWEKDIPSCIVHCTDGDVII